MSNKNKRPKTGIERRQHTRYRSVFPVEFGPVDYTGDKERVFFRQGYTCDLSESGLCLETINIDKKTFSLLERENAMLIVRIVVPLDGTEIRCLCDLMWMRKERARWREKYYFGLKFHQVDKHALDGLLRQVRWRHYSNKILSGALMFLLVAFAVIFSVNYFIHPNKAKLAQKSQRQETPSKPKPVILQGLRPEKPSSEKEKVGEQESGTQTSTEGSEKAFQKEEMMSDAEQKPEWQKDLLRGMSQWLDASQNSSTGLIASFQGAGSAVSGYAFTYDQALAVNAFCVLEDFKSARQILEFFWTKLTDNFNGFPSAYRVDSGEKIVDQAYAGPAIWIGIAVLQYTQMSQDTRYVPLAIAVADWILTLQESGQGGEVPAGPWLDWVSREHQLDAYAFLEMLHGYHQDIRYPRAQQRILNWLIQNAMLTHNMKYNYTQAQGHPGDATIATDTLLWAIPAIGPDRLKKLSLDPKEIIESVEGGHSVETEFESADGQPIQISGFDFSQERKFFDKGMVSSEWTCQVIIAYQVLSKYYQGKGNTSKAKEYREKAQKYLEELYKLILVKPIDAERVIACLPLATTDEAASGHGWQASEAMHSCNLTSTAYMIMAVKNFNPLRLKKN